MVEHDLDGVGIEELVRVADRVARRGDGRFRRVLEQGCDRADQPRLDERLVALHVDHHVFRARVRGARRPRAMRSVPVG